MSLIERILTRLFPREELPWGTRWKLAGALTGHEDTSRSLLKRPIGTKRGYYLHRMVRPDGDRPTHDHPYDWTSYILAGSYLEKMRDPSGKVTYRTWVAGEVNRKAATESHKILSVEQGQPTWTLFCAGERKREWGFVVPDPRDWKTATWVNHEVYKRCEKEWSDRQEQIAERGMD